MFTLETVWEILKFSDHIYGPKIFTDFRWKIAYEEKNVKGRFSIILNMSRNTVFIHGHLSFLKYINGTGFQHVRNVHHNYVR